LLLLSSKFLSLRRARHACAEIERFGDKCGAWVEFRRALRNPISSDEQRCATGSIGMLNNGPGANVEAA